MAGAQMYVVVLISIMSTSSLAGPLYGTIIDSGRPIQRAQIEAACPDFDNPVSRAQSRTDDGSYRLMLQARGRCVLRVAAFPAVTIYSSDNPIRYDFEVVRGQGAPTLRRR